MGMAAAHPCAWPSPGPGRFAHQIGSPADLSNPECSVGSIPEIAEAWVV
jgi:hypothetical protein